MTSTLADFHSSGIGLEVLKETNEGSGYVREVVLFAEPTGKPVEYGAIQIQLDHFRPEVRNAIVEGKEPLGSILNRMQYTYASRPKGFSSFKLRWSARNGLAVAKIPYFTGDIISCLITKRTRLRRLSRFFRSFEALLRSENSIYHE